MSTGLFITAIAPELETFLLGRIVTGCGAAGVMTTTIILVLELSSRKRRGLFLGLLSASYTTGITSGAVLAGVVAPAFHWDISQRAVYYVQAVFALIAGLLVCISIPSSPRPQTKDSIKKTLGQLDYLGFLTLTGSMILLLYSLASTDIPALPIILSIILFIAFLIVETRYAAQPIIPLTVLGSRSVLTTCFANIGFMISRWAVLFYTPIYALAVRGWPPASAGLILIPTNAGFGLGGLLVGWAHIRKADSYYTSCLVTYLLFALTFLPLSSISTPDSDVVYYVIGVFLNGFFAGALMNYTLSHLLYLTIPQIHFILTSVVAMSRSFAGKTGFIEHGIDEPELIHQLLGSPALVTTLTGIRKHIAVEAYEDATTTLFLAGCALTVAATAIQAGTGWNSPNNVTKNNIENLDGADVVDTEEYQIQSQDSRLI
ncbi:Major facilitator superfamily domain containing protein [Elaphomyces granulatus]